MQQKGFQRVRKRTLYFAVCYHPFFQVLQGRGEATIRRGRDLSLILCVFSADQTDRDRRRPMGEINGKCPGLEEVRSGREGRFVRRFLHLERGFLASGGGVGGARGGSYF